MQVELRERTEENVRIYFERTRDPEIQARIPQRSQTVEQALEDYRRSLAPGADSYGRTVWADGVYVGDVWCYCIHAEADPDAMVSYCIFDKDRWRQGIASRALEQFLSDAGPRFGLKRVGAFAYADNPASVRVLEKNGFTIQETFEEEGRRSFYLVREIKKQGGWINGIQSSKQPDYSGGERPGSGGDYLPGLRA